MNTPSSPTTERPILVTGAAGFIGSNVVQQLLDNGHRVVGVDNINDYYTPDLKQHRVKALSKNSVFTFHPLDIEDRAGLGELFKTHTFGSVINLAARAGVRASIENPFVYYSTNQGGTLNLLELMREHGTPKIVLASTSSLYAGQPMPFVESMPVNEPISPYAASKKAAEVLAYTYHHLFDIDVSIVRYFTVYGPAGRPDMSPYRFFNWIAREQPIQLFGDGQQRRDFTFVDCVARGTIAAMRPTGYEIFNIGNGSPHSILEMIQMMEELVGKKAIIEFLPTHATDMPATWADASKAKSMLDWEANIDLKEGLQKTWQWHQEYFAHSPDGRPSLQSAKQPGSAQI